MAFRLLKTIPVCLISLLFSLMFSVCCIVFTVTPSFAAMTPQAIPTTDTLYAVYFVDANIGYAVGANGTVIKTVDGGSNWTITPPASAGTAPLRSVYFIDASTGWAVGDQGIYRTLDGGNSWPLQIYATQFDHVVFTPDGSRGFAGNQDGRIYWTNDGGNTWPLHPETFGAPPAPAPIISIEFVDNSTGFLVHEDRDIYTTSDGGNTWNPIPSSPPAQLGTLLDSSWVDSQHGWVVGTSSLELSYTTDGGITWDEPASLTGDFTAVHFTDTQNGWVVMDTGAIMTSSDGGQTWLPVPGWTNTEFLYDVFVAPGGEVYVVGDPDAIYTETPPITLVKQVWELGGTTPLASPLTAPTGARLVFLIYVKNDTSSAINNVTFIDNLDNTTFVYMPNSLSKDNGTLLDTATDLEIFNNTQPPARGGSGISQTDDIGGPDFAAACTGPGPGPGHCPGVATNTITFGATSINANTTLDLPANSTIAFSFEVSIQ